MIMMYDAKTIREAAEQEKQQRIINAGAALSMDIRSAGERYHREIREAERVFELRLTGIRKEDDD